MQSTVYRAVMYQALNKQVPVPVPVPVVQVPVQVPVRNLQVPVPVQVLCINYRHSVTVSFGFGWLVATPAASQQHKKIFFLATSTLLQVPVYQY